MAEPRFDPSGPCDSDRPNPVNGFRSAGPLKPDQSALGDRRSPGITRGPSPPNKLGSRDYCGFELDIVEPSDAPGFEDSFGGWMSPVPGARDLVDLGGARPRRGVEISGAPRRVDVKPGRPMPVTPEPLDGGVGLGPDEPDRPVPGSFSRVRAPEVPGYEILDELGRGGMGVVYKARQRRLNRMVALKMILAGDYAGADAVERIMAEAEIVARLQHPNIVQIYAIGDCDGRPYVELEYVAGGSLADRLDGTPWPPRAAARLVQSLALAMAEAHRMGIIHRDLKPANILMTDDGTPKITDFGLAKSIEKNSGLTRTESILGSPRYMAPEQAEGHTRLVGPAADVYALGTNLYELLTGRPPFVAPTILATLELVKNAEPVPPRRLQPALASDLETICLKCLRKEATERYASADALAEDLARYLNGEPILARPTSSWDRTWKWARRRPSLAALVIVSTLSILATAGGIVWYRADLNRQRALARRREADVRAQVDQCVVLGEEAIRRADWVAAKSQLSSAMALARTEERLGPIRAIVGKLLEQTDVKIAERTSREAALSRLATFQKYYDEAVFYQSDYTGLAPDDNRRAGRAAARRALEQFDPKEGAGTGLCLATLGLDPTQVGLITTRYYELALLLADATAQPLPGEDAPAQARLALEILEQARRARSPTANFHDRRAAYLEQKGDAAGAAAERKIATTLARPDQSSIDDFLEGESAYQGRDYKKAVAAFRRVLAREPDHFWAQYLLAICHLKEHRPSEAQAALTACQNRRPGFVWTYLLKGFAEGEMREFDLAEDDFARATALGLGDAERYVMLVNRGVMRVRRGRYEAATADFLAAIAQKPDEFQAYVDLAQAFQSRKRLDEALVALNQAIARAPTQPVVLRARAQLYRLRSEDEKARRDLDQAIDSASPGDPNLADDHLERALIHERAGRHAEALADCDRALELQPGRPDIHRARGAVLVKLKRFDDAIRSFDVCLARGNSSAALYEARGLALAHGGQYDRAIADYTLALSRGRRTGALLTHRAWAYLFSGAPGPAVHDFDEALRLDPADGRALSGRALALVQEHKVREAVADARASVMVNGHDHRLLYSAARIYCQAAALIESDPARSHGEWAAAGSYRAEALALIARAIDLLPVDDRAQFWTGVVRPDTALAPIKKSRKFLELEAQVARANRRDLAGEGTSR